MRKAAPWIIAALVIAAIVHVVSLHALPRFVMARAVHRMGAVNTMHFGRRPDATSRTVVRPSPDLLYAACPYDLSDGPLLVTAPVPPGTYWSVSVFDADTNNIFVRNDLQLHGQLYLMIYPPGASPKAEVGAAVVSPTLWGVVLTRTLIEKDNDLPALEAFRHRASCGIVR